MRDKDVLLHILHSLCFSLLLHIRYVYVIWTLSNRSYLQSRHISICLKNLIPVLSKTSGRKWGLLYGIVERYMVTLSSSFGLYLIVVSLAIISHLLIFYKVSNRKSHEFMELHFFHSL